MVHIIETEISEPLNMNQHPKGNIYPKMTDMKKAARD
jgi:hypothetical protein